MQTAVVADQVVLTVIFLVSTVSKLRSRVAWTEFRGSVAGLKLVRPGGVAPLAGLTVVAEGATVLALAALPRPVLAFALAATVLAALTVVAAGASRRGLTAPCRCFGPSRRPLGRVHLTRNAVLLALAVTGVAATWAEPGRTPVQHLADPAGSIVALVAGALLALLLIRLDDVVDLFRAPAPAPARSHHAVSRRRSRARRPAVPGGPGAHVRGDPPPPAARRTAVATYGPR